MRPPAPFHDVFVEVSTAVGRDTGCGRTGPMAELRVFDNAPGVVARCLGCGEDVDASEYTFRVA
jgi:Family of unknown function (DUF6510)